MTYAGNQTAIVQVKTIVTGQLCYNTFEYGTEAVGKYTTPGTFLSAWLSTNISNWLACLSDQAQILSVSVATTSPTGVPPYAPAMDPINDYGTEAAQSLPPYASYRIYKQPNNAAFEGTMGTDFRIGMIRIPGVPETFQTGGLLVTAAVGAVDALADALTFIELTPVGGGLDIQFNMIMVRREVGNPANFGLVPVLATYASTILGTQNSRKIT